MTELRNLLKKRDYWTAREVLELIKEEYGIEYSLKRIGIILKNFGMHTQNHMFLTTEDLKMQKKF